MKSFKTRLCSLGLAAVTAAGFFMGTAVNVRADEIPAQEVPAPEVPMMRSVYTNEPVTEAQAALRPIAAMIPTDKKAQPSYGIGSADVLYEIMEEGNISRQMAIIPGWQSLPQIGNLRSCRLYYIPVAKEWDPILVHFGGVYPFPFLLSKHRLPSKHKNSILCWKSLNEDEISVPEFSTNTIFLVVFFR